MKRTVSFILSLIMVIGIITSVPVTVSAASESDLTFSLNRDDISYCVSDCITTASGEIVIPSTYNGLPVTGIGYCAFAGCNDISSVEIPESVTSIGARAFEDCTGLALISIPDSVTSIREDAFGNTGYYNDENNWEDGVLYIGNHLIRAYNISNATYIIKDGTKTVADYAFESCTNLESVVIGDSVTSIGVRAFDECTRLASISISDSVTSIGDNAFYNTSYYNCDSNWEDDVLYIGNHLIEAYYIPNATYKIKDGTKTIADYAFKYCSNLVSVTISDSVTTIGKTAFSGCKNLKSAIIGDSVTNIGDEAFLGCENLTVVAFGDNVTSIGEGAFRCCSKLTGVTIPDSVTKIGDNAFEDCDSFTSVMIPDSVITIGNEAFYGCENLTSAIIGNGVINMGDSVFKACGSLASVVIGNSVTSIGCSAFTFCESLTSISIPDSVTNIGDSAFQACENLASVKLGDSVENIGMCAFESCYLLVSISLPESLTYIGSWAFDDCHSLEKVDYRGTTSQWKNIDILTGNNHLINAYYSQFKLPTTPKLKSVSNAVDGVKVVWNAVDGADEYIVYRKTAKSGWANLGTTTETTFTDKTAKSGTTYYYTVKAQNGAGASGYNKTGLAIKYLAAPKLSKVYNNGAGNVLSWGKVTGASGYYVYRKTPSSGWSKVATIKKGTTASYTDKKVTYGKTYIYTVKAYSGKTSSSFNADGVTILKKIPNVTITTKNVNGGKRVTLSSSISGATIYYKTSKDGKYKKYTGEFGLTSTKTIYTYAVRSGYYKSSTASKKITVTKVKTPTIKVANCVGGKKISFTSGTTGATFYYKTSKNGSYVKYTEPFTLTSTKTIYVKAYKPGYATSSTASKKVSVSKIGTPTGLTVKSYASTSTKISWKKVSGAQGYFIYRATEKDGAYTLVHTIKSGTTVSKTDTGLEPTTTYYYKVRAYCSGKASSSYTAAVGATTKATPTTTDAKNFFNNLTQQWTCEAFPLLFTEDANFFWDEIKSIKAPIGDIYESTAYTSYVPGTKLKISSVMTKDEFAKYKKLSSRYGGMISVYKLSDLQNVLDDVWAPGRFSAKNWANGRDMFVTSKGYFIMLCGGIGGGYFEYLTKIKSCTIENNTYTMEVYVLNWCVIDGEVKDESTGKVLGYLDGWQYEGFDDILAALKISESELETVTVVLTDTSSGLRLESMTR